MIWVYISAALIAILLALPVGYLSAGALDVGKDTARAEQALQRGVAHTALVAESIKGPTIAWVLVPTKEGLQELRQQLAGWGSSLRDASGQLGSAIAELESADSSLKSDAANPLLWRDKSRLATQQRRVEALISGLHAARSAIGIVQGQLPALIALADVADSLLTLGPLLDKRDVNGALGAYPVLDQRMQTLQAAISASTFSPHFVKSIKDLKTLTDDMRWLLQSVQARDAAGVSDLVPKVKADITVVSGDDFSDMGSFERKLLEPYIDKYDQGITDAGFTQTFDTANV